MAIDFYLRYDKRQKRNTQFIIVMEFVNPDQKLTDYKFKFTKREADIIDGIVQGKNNIQLAKALNLSENTIKTHVKSIYRKAGANNRAELTYLLMLNK
jgi:DNA-binding NarL/FixJ family response regulator